MSSPPTAIICLDLDGTSVEYDAIHVWFSDTVAEALNAAARCGAVWCANSGRRADNQHGLIQSCRTLDTMPVAILANERYIYDVNPNTGVMRSRRSYNHVAKEKAHKLVPQALAALAPHRARIDALGVDAEYFPTPDFIGWLLDASTDPVGFAAMIGELLRTVGDAQVLRNGQWVIVTHADFGKGKVLEDAARGLGIPREHILAIGDENNDLDMLDGRSAAYVGCPADADGDARTAVERAGGWIAAAPAHAGTAELIDRFVNQVLS